MSTDPSPDAPQQPPMRLAHLPVHGGLAVPWITPTLHGRPRFGAIDQDRAHHCLRHRLGGV